MIFDNSLEPELVSAKTIVTRAKSSEWFGMDYNMNLYRGCSHGCIYCDSRSDCYHNPDFDRVKVKAKALEIVRNDLRRKAKPGVIATGAMSDPYNPLEERLCLTRNAMELINAYEFGVSIDTKSPLIRRDVDILKDIASHSPVLVKMTITTADDDLCKKLEPNVAPTSQRWSAIEALAGEGLFCGILMMPLLPFINDSEENISAIVHTAKKRGARFIYPSLGVTMRDGQREYFCSQLDRLFPGMGAKYMKRFGNRYQCGSDNAATLWKNFTRQCDELGMLYKMPDIISAYKQGYESAQLKFF